MFLAYKVSGVLCDLHDCERIISYFIHKGRPCWHKRATHTHREYYTAQCCCILCVFSLARNSYRPHSANILLDGLVLFLISICRWFFGASFDYSLYIHMLLIISSMLCVECVCDDNDNDYCLRADEIRSMLWRVLPIYTNIELLCDVACDVSNLAGRFAGEPRRAIGKIIFKFFIAFIQANGRQLVFI